MSHLLPCIRHICVQLFPTTPNFQKQILKVFFSHSGTIESCILKSSHFERLFHIIVTHTRPFNGPLSGTTQVSRYQKGKTNLDFTEARDSEWQWHQLGHMQVCTSPQTDNHASTSLLSFLQAGCPS